MVLADEPICHDPYEQHPGRVVPTTDVDHIISMRRGGDNSRANLQGLCHECHSYKTVIEDGGFVA